MTIKATTCLRTLIAAAFIMIFWPQWHAHGEGEADVAGLSFISLALADDGDDGDDDGGGFSGGSRGVGEGGSVRPRQAGPLPRVVREPLRSLRSLFGSSDRRRSQRPARNSAPVAAPLPERADREIAALGLSDDQIGLLEGQGYGVLERARIGLVGSDLVKLALPEGVSLEDARIAVGALNAGSTVDFNHYYRPENDGQRSGCSGPHCAAPQMIAWPAGNDPTRLCGRPVSIGLIDTGINVEHETFAGGALRLIASLGGDADASDRKHGTAVAALLIGAIGSRSPGLFPGAPLLAVDAFTSKGDDTRADTFSLVAALDGLVEENAAVINLSLAGPDNAVLRRSIDAASESGVMLVAAAGNAGPRAAPLYPAAYPPVIAVTAVDRDGRAYRRAVRGAHIDVAAPGVDIWTAASISGARPKSGTSFAAPFVTAAAAIFKSRSPNATAGDFRRYLEATADDLGEEGRDEVYGHGLLQVDALCAPRIAGLWEPAEARLPAYYVPAAEAAPGSGLR
jgi:subtilisin family serine protease